MFKPCRFNATQRSEGEVRRELQLKRRAGGFTLVELGIVVAVLLVLAVGVGYFFGVGGQSRNAALLAFQRTVGDAALRMNANTN
jgi:type II secretory pathway pseudopilin PulG